MATKEKLQSAIESRRHRTPPPDLDLSKGPRAGKSLQRTSSLRARGEDKRELTPVLRRERTDDSLRGSRRSPAAPSGTPLKRSQSTRNCGPTRGQLGSPAGPSGAPLKRSQSTRNFGPSRCQPGSPADSPGMTRSVSGQVSSLGSDFIARNGTTFSSRCNKYVVHCSKRADDENYLTPTQRSARDLKRLRGLLEKAYHTIRSRDAELARLKRQLTLRPRRSSAREPPEPQEPPEPGPEPSEPPAPLDLSLTDGPGSAPSPGSDGPGPSVCDSGACDCLTPPSVASDDKAPVDGDNKLAALELEARLGDDWEATEHWIECEEQRLRDEHELRVQQLNRQHSAEYQEMKEKYNDKVEDLLQKLAEANTRYFELRPLHDTVCLRVRQLEMDLQHHTTSGRDSACQTTAPPPDPDPDPAQAPAVAAVLEQLRRREAELDRVRGYWGSVFNFPRSALRACVSAGLPATAIDLWTATTQRLQKGVYQQQLAALEASHQLGAASPSAEMDAPMRLQFLRSAVYHFLTDRDGYSGHLSAIAAVLKFSECEVQEVERVRAGRLSQA